MKYTMYYLSFPAGVHFGGKSLDESRNTFAADTLFSALYIEARKMGGHVAEELFEAVKNGRILFSDAFPFIGETAYLPKPMVKIEHKDTEGDSTIKKAFKNLPYIPFEKMEIYLKGDLDAISEKEKLKKLGKSYLKTSASIKGLEDTLPYRVGVYYFHENAGLYVIIGTEDSSDEKLVSNLMTALSFAGIGGKRTAGIGRFQIVKNKSVEPDYFQKKGKTYMSLSISLPTDAEIEKILPNARFQMLKRSGFVQSPDYSDEPRKKKDIFLISSGSCFESKYEGNIYDVSDGGSHAVYRYAKPMFFTLTQ